MHPKDNSARSAAVTLQEKPCHDCPGPLSALLTCDQRTLQKRPSPPDFAEAVLSAQASARPQTPQHRASLLRHSRAQFEAFPGAGAWRGGLQLRGKVLSPGRPFLLPQWSSGIQPYLLTAWTSRPLDWSKHTYGLTHTHSHRHTHSKLLRDIYL